MRIRFPKVRMNLKLKILGGLSLIMAVTLTVILNGVEGSKEILDQSYETEHVTFPALERSTVLIDIVNDTKSELLNGFEMEDASIVESLEEMSGLFTKEVEQILSVKPDPELDSIKALYLKYSDLAIEAIHQVAEGGVESVSPELMQTNYPMELTKKITEYREGKLRAFTKAMSKITNQADNFSKVFLISGLVLLLVIIAVTLESETVFKQLQILVRKARGLVSDGRKGSVDPKKYDEFEQIEKVFKIIKSNKEGDRDDK